MGGAADGTAGDDFLRALDALVSDAVAQETARERSHERVLRSIASAEATFLGVALDLAEQGTGVVVRASSGRSHRGRVLAVGRDFLVLRDGVTPPVFLAAEAVSSVRPQSRWGDGAEPAGARAAPLAVSLTAVLARLSGDRPRVQVVAAGDESVAGELRSVGVDVLTIRLDGDRRLVAHIRLGAVRELVLLDL